MSTDSNDEPWVLLRPDYNSYLAVPLAHFRDLMRHSKVVVKESYSAGAFELGKPDSLSVSMMSHELMIAAQVRSRMLGERSSEQ